MKGVGWGANSDVKEESQENEDSGSDSDLQVESEEDEDEAVDALAPALLLLLYYSRA